jgi:hypothetical protein
LKGIQKRRVDPGFPKGSRRSPVFGGDVETVIRPDSLNVQSPAAEVGATGPALSQLPTTIEEPPEAGGVDDVERLVRHRELHLVRMVQ